MRVPPALLCACLALLARAAPTTGAEARPVAALGRLEPQGGVIRVAGPSLPTAVIAELRVEEGDRVEKEQVLAILDGYPRGQAAVAEARAELENAQRELDRSRRLVAGKAASGAQRDLAQMRVEVARARAQAAQAELDLSIVRAPIAGRVLEIHARPGERVGAAGILELGRTDAMVAVAEVYETDVTRVAVGQRARIQSPALAAPLSGVVERIGLKIGKQDLLDADPVARTDARVVEVEIRIEGGQDVSGLTNLQVKVEIGP